MGCLKLFSGKFCAKLQGAPISLRTNHYSHVNNTCPQRALRGELEDSPETAILPKRRDGAVTDVMPRNTAAVQES